MQRQHTSIARRTLVRQAERVARVQLTSTANASADQQHDSEPVEFHGRIIPRNLPLAIAERGDR